MQMETASRWMRAPLSTMDYYQHDGATSFRFQLAGDLAGPCVTDLEHAWHTASSIMTGKQLVVDVSDLTSADVPGVQLLQSMLKSGAQLVSAQPPASPDLLRTLGAPISFRPRLQAPKSLWAWIRAAFARR